MAPFSYPFWHPPPAFGMFPETSISPTKTWKILGLKIMTGQPTPQERRPYEKPLWTNWFHSIRPAMKPLFMRGVRYGGRGCGWLATRKVHLFFWEGWILAMAPCKQQEHFPHTELQGGNTFSSHKCGEITPIRRVITPVTRKAYMGLYHVIPPFATSRGPRCTDKTLLFLFQTEGHFMTGIFLGKNTFSNLFQVLPSKLFGCCKWPFQALSDLQFVRLVLFLVSISHV